MTTHDSNQKKRQMIKGIIIFAIYIAVVVILIRYVLDNKDIVHNIQNAPPQHIVIGLLTTAFSIMLSGYLDITCAKVYGEKISVKDATIFTFVATALNLVLPLQMGSIVKAVYYKRKLKLAYSRYISIASGTMLLGFIMSYFVLIISLAVLIINWHIEVKYFWLVALMFACGIAILILIIRKKKWILSIIPFKRYTIPIMQGFFEILTNKRAIVLCSINLFISILLGGIRFIGIFQILNIPSSYVGGLMYYGIYKASSVIPLLPGNIGVSELLVGGMNSILGEGFNKGVTLILINRVYYYVVVLAGAVLCAIPAWRAYKRTERIDK